MSSMRVAAALERARADAQAPTLGPPDGHPRTRRLAMGDPQAPLEKCLAVLDAHGALDAEGRLASEVHLLSIGDHFDWGQPEDRPNATSDGLALLAWLAAHPEDQVTLILGNHDLGRVGELAELDAERFERARAEADRAYRRGDVDQELEAELLSRLPGVPSAETLARDLSCFSVPQRTLVERLIRASRMRLAHAAAPDLLFVHAAVTRDDLAALGLSRVEARDAFAVAAAIEDRLQAAVASWREGSRLEVPPLHVPGDRQREARGIASQRPSRPEASEAERFDGPPRRRFDPRALPVGLTLAAGHIRDGKARSLLGPWAIDPPQPEGPLRQLVTDGREVAYSIGVSPRPEDAALMIFIDGGMLRTPVERYALLDVARRAPADHRPCSDE